ncbi:transducer protein car [Xanthomonas hyacinthi]|uniref:Transducer protein car n=1 Tax=Xanthomonas hyacinthi TaxID=56455 RepID=A0A2S7ER80_9XANT|nr:transducer protein car [Xanthomonas hyacinthi]
MQTQATLAGRRARAHAGAPGARQLARALDAWLARRAKVHSESSLGDGGRLLRYVADARDPQAPRNEAFFTSCPGLLVAALTVDPELQVHAGPAPTAERIAAQLAAPPIGLLTGIWQGADGCAFIERAGHLHLAGADGRWTPLRPLGMDRAPALRMIGRQADGAVYVHDSQLWRAQSAAASMAPIAAAPAAGVLRIDASGTPLVLHDGVLSPLADPAARRPLQLWRAVPGGNDFEPSPAQPVDLLPLPGASAHEALILDDKGRVYHADLRGHGAIQARRMHLPEGRRHQDGWAVTRMGLAVDGTVHLLLERQAGRRALLQRPPGTTEFRPAYLLDQPLLLIHAEGLHAPAESAVRAHVLLDGHARLGHVDGVLHYQPAPEQAWDRLTLRNGEPLTGVDALLTSPFGFVDRRPAFALLDEQRRLVELNLGGRTTWLPANAEPSHPSGGPLAIAPDQLHVDATQIASFDAPVKQLAVHADRSVAVLSASDTLHLIRRGHPAHELKGLHRPMAIAIGLDDSLHALDRADDGRIRLLQHVADDAWREMPLALPAAARPTSLRSTRSGQLQLQLDDRWHALLPPMTAADGTRQASRVAPEPAQDESAAPGTQSGTNAILNAQQASRIRTQHHDASVTTTLLGATSTDPLSARSTVQVFAETAKAQAGSMARTLGNASLSAGRAMAQTVGIAVPQTAQDRRLLRFRDEAQRTHAGASRLLPELAILAEVRVASAVGPQPVRPVELSAAQCDRLLQMREAELGALLRDLRKIGIRERAIAPDFSWPADGTAAARASTASYRAAELWRRARSVASAAIDRVAVRDRNDVLPAVDDCLQALAAAATGRPATLSVQEAGLLLELGKVSRRLRAAGVVLPADALGASGGGGAPHALRTACVLGSLVEYDALLRTDNAQALRQAEDRQQASALRPLSKLGLSSWQELEAFDDVVTTFREQVAAPGTARRLQLLKSLGLPRDAAPDEMAARMADLLQDLFNRSTFFSVASTAAEVRGSIGYPLWTQINPVSLGVGGEAIHALGVERIGDSKDTDAGLVAFFVRHAKASVSGTSGVKIDFDPDFTSLPLYASKSSGATAALSWGGAGSLGMAGTYQHGVGAAVILAPSTIPEFARLLFDRHDADTTKLLRAGVHQGSIGLDLFETNLSATATLSLPTAGAAYSRTYGTQKPAPDSAHPAAPSAGNRRSTAAASATAGATWQAGVHWNEMELHLDHAWTDIIGLEFQGRADFSIDAGINLTAGAGVASAFGTVFRHLISALTGAGNLQLAGIRATSGDVQLPLDAALGDTPDGMALGTASYKRTLDAKAASPITAASWEQMAGFLAKAFPEGAAELDSLDYPPTPSERIAFLQHAILRIQGERAHAIEARDVLDGATLRLQRQQAQAATLAAAGSLWHSRSESARADLLQMLHEMRLEETLAAQHRARLIPGARLELNLFGRESLDAIVTHALGHVGLGSQIGDVAALRRQVPGLNEVLRRFKDIPNVNQVRFIFEMRPQALTAINDALAAKAGEQQAAALGAPVAAGMDWHAVLDKTRKSPDLYRLAAIAVHNTDANPVAHRVGLPFINLSTSAGTSHQLFEAEIQFRYGLYDRIQGAEVLEAGSRALQPSLPLDGVRMIGRQGIARSSQFGPPSPRADAAQLHAQSASARSSDADDQQIVPAQLPFALSPQDLRTPSLESAQQGSAGAHTHSEREQAMAESRIGLSRRADAGS